MDVVCYYTVRSVLIRATAKTIAAETIRVKWFDGGSQE